jgi:transcriptional regulator with XRE-family HTH domain
MDSLRELGAAVRHRRTEVGLSGAELARRAGVPQPSVSRLEMGRRLADVAIAERLVLSLELDGNVTRELARLARDAYAAPPERRAGAGVSMTAGQLRRRVLACGLARSFSCAMVPPLLRTGDYATAVAADRPGAVGDVSGLVEDASRSFVFVVTEGALRTWPGDVSMGEQLATVEALSRRPNVRLGVLPWQTMLPRAPLCDFTIVGDDAVWVETFAAEFTLTGASHVAAFAAAFGAFESAAVFGDDARSLIAAIAADFGRHP